MSGPPPPGWYDDPSGKPGSLYWDGQRWHPPVSVPTGPPKREGPPTPLLWALAFAVAFVIVATLVYFWSHHKKSTSPSASPSITTEVTVTTPESTGAQGPSSTYIEGSPSAPQTIHGTMVGTCDEGGTCGVRQRTAPFDSASSLSSDLLADGQTVTLACQTTGDVKTNTGYGTSSVWYRLTNGAYVNSVYMLLDGPATSIPPC